MNNEEKAIAKEVLEFLKEHNLKIEGFEAYDNEENYTGTLYYFFRKGKPTDSVSVESVFDAQFDREGVMPSQEAKPDEPTLIRLANEERAEHLARYLVNTAKRTGQEWVVIEQYKTEGASWRGESSYERALLKATDGSTVRIYYKWWTKCWVRGQKVLSPKS